MLCDIRQAKPPVACSTNDTLQPGGCKAAMFRAIDLDVTRLARTEQPVKCAFFYNNKNFLIIAGTTGLFGCRYIQ